MFTNGSELTAARKVNSIDIRKIFDVFFFDILVIYANLGFITTDLLMFFIPEQLQMTCLWKAHQMLTVHSSRQVHNFVNKLPLHNTTTTNNTGCLLYNKVQYKGLKRYQCHVSKTLTNVNWDIWQQFAQDRTTSSLPLQHSFISTLLVLINVQRSVTMITYL
jgi:hypothetical protein